MTIPPLSTYPEDREKLLSLCGRILNETMTIDDYSCVAADLADLVKGILEDEQYRVSIGLTSPEAFGLVWENGISSRTFATYEEAIEYRYRILHDKPDVKIVKVTVSWNAPVEAKQRKEAE